MLLVLFSSRTTQDQLISFPEALMQCRKLWEAFKWPLSWSYFSYLRMNIDTNTKHKVWSGEVR